MSDIATYAEIRDRLRVSVSELPDATLASAAFIPAATAYLVALGIDYSSLPAASQPLAKAAFIAMVCATAVSQPPDPGAKYGPVEIKAQDSGQLQMSAKAFEGEAKKYLKLLGVSVGSGGFAVCGQGTTEYNDMATALGIAPL